MINYKGKKINVTKELQEFLIDKAPINTKKAIISSQRNDTGEIVQKKDIDGKPMFNDAVIDPYKFVYFDINGNHYFRVFRTINENGLDIIVTNKEIETKEDCNLYAKGIEAYRKIIPGSELWDNGSDASFKHREIVSKGDPNFKIVAKFTREEIISINLQPTGDSLVAKVANSSDAEKAVILEQLFGKDFAAKLAKLSVSEEVDPEA